MSIKSIIPKLKYVFTPALAGFYFGHTYLDRTEIAKLKSKIGSDKSLYTEIFEEKFAKIVGLGNAVSFASGRMSFYVLMKVLGIGSGDEVVLCGSTCSVMPNAILKVGARPIYADVDKNTFGSCPRSIEACITPNTRLIVAQHSFGIPCEIDLIVKLCRDNGIFLIEDCALALGSKLRDKSVGTFGDAAIFSTDHSKPINTIIGGLVYSENYSIVEKVRAVQRKCKNLPSKKQKALWTQFIVERSLAKLWFYGALFLYNLIHANIGKRFGWLSPFLDEDASDKTNNVTYPYPSKLPEFVGLLGIYELARWDLIAAQRRESLNFYKTKLLETLLKDFIPDVYFDNTRYIIPLRFVFSCPQAVNLRSKLKNLITVEETWFMKPIINCNGTLDKFFYKDGQCPTSELIGPMMVNLPLVKKEAAIKIIRRILKVN